MATVPSPAPPSVSASKSASEGGSSVKPAATGNGTSIITASPRPRPSPAIGYRTSPVWVTDGVRVGSAWTVFAANDQADGVNVTVASVPAGMGLVVVTSNRNVLGPTWLGGCAVRGGPPATPVPGAPAGV